MANMWWGVVLAWGARDANWQSCAISDQALSRPAMHGLCFPKTKAFADAVLRAM